MVTKKLLCNAVKPKYLTNILAGAAVVNKTTIKKTTTTKKATTTKKVVKKTPKMKAFDILDEGNLFQARIQINSNEIKQFMIRQDSDLVGMMHLINANETNKDLKLVKSRFNIFDLINDGRSNRWLTFGYHSNDFDKFTDTLLEYEDKFNKLFDSADKDARLPFHSLPYVLKEGEELAFFDGETTVAFVLKNSQIISSFFGTYLKMEGTILHNNGKIFLTGEYNNSIGAFSGDKALGELGLKKLKFYPEERQKLIERGKKYFALHNDGPTYMAYVGNVVRRNWYKDTNYAATGRIMIDRSGMMSIDPDYRFYFGGNDNDDGYGGRNKKFKETLEEITDEQYLIASPYCYGFSLNSKQWGEFQIDKISDITFRNNAYDSLVLNQETKDTMFSLVEYSGEGKDIIDNKGGGCIFLLHGAPGLGKTLTAEAIAETLHRPLYMVSVGELGTNVETLDNNLRNILQIASSWNAVLLIDEVDIFLEKRDLNIERNALVGVFLRLLEYYNGILFMTSNRAGNIDEAFYSRISLAIKYPELSIDAKEHIWTLHLGLYGITLSKKSITKLANFDINGRQIKNCIRLTTALAYKKGKKAGVDDFLAIIRQIEEFNNVLTTK